ncbi:Uma2 family endonuclease [Salicibibacter cibarius]|uniref:Uma2 family endonuclease n=1 Tax=Salicibibacter cibarius TaxID=2743000 RepID=A0A7T6Z1Q6_9BACI|nr:Uma2 family endonuclease [Salicibibacter cibarius]QQK75262.1 Uma2 family endonuclease [Salicibibacter cibarius]
MSLPKKNQTYTYTDYLSWPEDIRAEIIDGIPFMHATPSRIHQEILSELHRQIANFLVGTDCKVYPAPFHVVLGLENEDEKDSKDVFEPDITVVCDSAKLDDDGCKGSPDLVMEITSPSTARKDKIEKFNKYEQAGVHEFWIIEPQDKVVSVFTLDEKQRFGRPGVYSENDKVKVSIFADMVIDLNMVFSW